MDGSGSSSSAAAADDDAETMKRSFKKGKSLLNKLSNSSLGSTGGSSNSLQQAGTAAKEFTSGSIRPPLPLLSRLSRSVPYRPPFRPLRVLYCCCAAPSKDSESELP